MGSRCPPRQTREESPPPPDRACGVPVPKRPGGLGDRGDTEGVWGGIQQQQDAGRRIHGLWGSLRKMSAAVAAPSFGARPPGLPLPLPRGPPEGSPGPSGICSPRGAPQDPQKTLPLALRGGRGRAGSGQEGGLWGGGGRSLRSSPPGSAWIIIRIFFLNIYIYFSASPQHREPAREEINVRSITCQTLNWIGCFPPPLSLTPSMLPTRSPSPVGITAAEAGCSCFKFPSYEAHGFGIKGNVTFKFSAAFPVAGLLWCRWKRRVQKAPRPNPPLGGAERADFATP